METIKKGDDKKRQEIKKKKKLVYIYCLIYNNMCKIVELPSKHF